MADSVKKNIELNVSGNAKKEFLEIKKTLHELEIRAKWAGKKTEAQIENYIKNSNAFYDGQIQKEKELDKVRAENAKKEKERIKQRNQLLKDLSEYKGGNSIIGQSMSLWQASLKDRLEDYDKDEDIPESLKAEAARFKSISGVIGNVATVFNSLNVVLSPVIRGLHSLEKQITANVEALINMRNGLATYGSSTLITNATARNVRLQWGLSASQYAGYSQAASLLNVNSEEDLYYMNEDQRNLFMNYMKKYSAYYDKLESSGVLRNIQELQLSFEEFKTEMSYEFLSWVADNREAIIGALDVIKDGVLVIGQIAKGIFNKIGLGGNNGVYSPSSLYNNTIGLNNDWRAAESEAELRTAGFTAQS